MARSPRASWATTRSPTARSRRRRSCAARADPEARLHILPSARAGASKKTSAARYTPVAKRNDRPDAIAFLLRNFPQLTEAQVGKLLGTTKETIQKVRERTHWNSANIKPRDPVILGLCSQTRPESAVSAANERLVREGRQVPRPPPPLPETEAA